jgi:N-acetylneuraminic acid mutarotase
MLTRTGEIGPGVALLAAALLLASCDTEVAREDARAVIWHAGPPLPAPVTNNAVAAVELDGSIVVFSFLGLDASKTWSGVTNAAHRWDVGTDSWTPIDPVPGPSRLASTAQVVAGLIYVIGGYTVAADGAERSLPNVDVYDPMSGRWSRAADIPIPTDDAVAGVWADSLIVLVSGWHDTDNVADVQIFDPAANRWAASTPIPGVPVFGHTGGVAGDVVVYVDGTAVVDAEPRFALDRHSWAGRLLGAQVDWGEVVAHPGAAFYRAAGGTVASSVVFIGGSENPYNYDGVGYDGVPSQPIRQVLSYWPLTGEWRQLPAPPIASMDHRNLGVAGGSVFLVGGMHEDQVVTDNVWYTTVSALLTRVF